MLTGKDGENGEAGGPSPYFIKDSLCSSTLSEHIPAEEREHLSGKYCICDPV